MLRVASFYRFAPVAAPDALAGRLADHARGLRGTILVASEGINGSLAGDAGTLAAFRARIEGEPGLAGLPWTEGAAEAMPFDRLRIRLRREIVTMGIPGVDPAAQTGTAVDPADWNALIAAPDLVTIDTRNAYEVRLGSFEGAIDPGTAGFRDFPGWWQRNRATLEGRRVAMFCTGGIRCEKASSWLLAQGMAAVFQLRGGILAYLAAIPPTQSRWQGDCFVFDGRVAVGHGLVLAPVGLCHACRGPLTAADRAHPAHIPGIACPHCATTRTEAQRARYRARAAQMARGRCASGTGTQG